MVRSITTRLELKIAILSEAYLPHIGGQEVRYAEMGTALAAMGHAVHVYCIHYPDTTASEETVNGVHVHRRFPTARYMEPRFRAQKRQLLPLLRYALWCRTIVKNNDFDVLICNQWPLAHVMVLPKDKRRKAVLDWCEVRHSFPFPYLQKLLPTFVQSNMAVSTAVAEHIANESRRPVSYTPSGVYVDRYLSAGPEERRDLLYIGRIHEHKNLQLLIDTFAHLRKDGYDGKLLIAGTGPELRSLTKKVAQEGLASQVLFLGRISEDQKVDLLSKASVFVIPSRREGFPRVVAEAMASRLPVATVDYPQNGTKTVVQHYGIGVVSAPQVEALATSVKQILREWQTYSDNAARFRYELDWQYVVRNMLENLTVGEAVT